jgi:hypothetical protein
MNSPVKIPSSSDPSTTDLLDLIPRAAALPDEDPTALDALRSAFLRELAPGTPYETVLAEDIVRLEWEAQRERRLRDACLTAKYREIALGVFAHGKVSDYTLGADKQDTENAFALVGSDPKAREQAEARLAEHGYSRSEVTAAAYQRVGQQVGVHDRNLADLERRRRRLREEYDKLKSARLAKVVEDAEVVYE